MTSYPAISGKSVTALISCHVCSFIVHLLTFFTVLKQTIFAIAAVQIAVFAFDSLQSDFACRKVKPLLKFIAFEIRTVITAMRVCEAGFMFHAVHHLHFIQNAISAALPLSA
jgi:hypothetical protein